jgi:hypothetical protein
MFYVCHAASSRFIKPVVGVSTHSYFLQYILAKIRINIIQTLPEDATDLQTNSE